MSVYDVAGRVATANLFRVYIRLGLAGLCGFREAEGGGSIFLLLQFWSAAASFRQ